MYDAYASPKTTAAAAVAEYSPPTDPTSAGGLCSPARRHSVVSAASPPRYAPPSQELGSGGADRARSFGAALASVPDHAVPFPRQASGVAYRDEYGRAYEQERGPIGSYESKGAPDRYGEMQTQTGTSAAALLQQHAANQWAFRANQSTLPTPPQTAPHKAQAAPEPLYARRGSLLASTQASHLPSSRPPPPAYVPYGFASRPSPSPQEQSSSGSSTSASTPAAVPVSGATTAGTSSGSTSSRAQSIADTAAPAGDFSQSFYDPFRIKHRRRTSPAQLRILEHHFTRGPKPDLALRKQLAVELEMTPREVQVWVSYDILSLESPGAAC